MARRAEGHGLLGNSWVGPSLVVGRLKGAQIDEHAGVSRLTGDVADGHRSEYALPAVRRTSCSASAALPFPERTPPGLSTGVSCTQPGVPRWPPDHRSQEGPIA